MSCRESDLISYFRIMSIIQHGVHPVDKVWRTRECSHRDPLPGLDALDVSSAIQFLHHFLIHSLRRES